MKWLALAMLFLGVFGASYQYSQRFLEWVRFQSLGTRDYVAERLALMFIEVPPQKILVWMAALAFGMGTAGFLVFLPNLVPGLLSFVILTVIGWKAPKPIVDFMYRRRTEKLVLQMVDALSLMSNGLKSGLSVVQALGLVTQEMPNPIQQEFSLILSENKVGVSVEEAFNNFARRVKSDDVEMFVTSVNILKETGGNLAETFDTIVTTIRERIKVEKKISAMVAQGLYQGMFVMAIPPLLGTILYTSDPDLMEPLFTTPIGWAVLLIILGLEVAGFFVIMKVIKIEV